MFTIYIGIVIPETNTDFHSIIHTCIFSRHYLLETRNDFVYHRKTETTTNDDTPILVSKSYSIRKYLTSIL